MTKLLFAVFAIFSLLISAQSNAQTKQFSGDWITDIGGGYDEAYVTNDSKSSFGLICMDSCLWYVDFQKTCDDGDKYTALMADGSSAGAVELSCLKIGKRYILILNDFDMVQKATLRSENIGFSIALQGGKFHVSRFSLRGVKTAQERVFKAAASGRPSGKSTGYKDIKL
ncbi:hypothetical protein FD975_03570 [Polynucleobacter sp. AP-Jannik-300A-C4]|jgi:hypothetical protein|uniref:hypothetical protein n=1 Tax=Polynucleobacter sp. AP-Jannik-300A-C4 TaxID=2576928 RepID=UPI001BFE20EE|nr:hypothetical protein [Polynucleobacter sp. AP-Jannik-300A-C4]QWE23298.1 hypothetical protein FD975_03570 [Polynucleobacter sp. AP-Jannik-300A-C4]